MAKTTTKTTKATKKTSGKKKSDAAPKGSKVVAPHLLWFHSRRELRERERSALRVTSVSRSDALRARVLEYRKEAGCSYQKAAKELFDDESQDVQRPWETKSLEMKAAAKQAKKDEKKTAAEEQDEQPDDDEPVDTSDAPEQGDDSQQGDSDDDAA